MQGRTRDAAARVSLEMGIGIATEHGYFSVKSALVDRVEAAKGTLVTLRDQINGLTPRLRRYSRALTTGSPAACALADDVVHSTLMRALGARQIGSSADLEVRLFATVTQLHRDALATPLARAAVSGRPALVSSQRMVPEGDQRYGTTSQLAIGLAALSIEEREAILLVALEGFDYGEAARILRVSRSVLVARLTSARTALDTHLRSRPSPTPAARRTDVPYLRVVR